MPNRDSTKVGEIEIVEKNKKQKETEVLGLTERWRKKSKGLYKDAVNWKWWHIQNRGCKVWEEEKMPKDWEIVLFLSKNIK